jgi:hypothetical protein
MPWLKTGLLLIEDKTMPSPDYIPPHDSETNPRLDELFKKIREFADPSGAQKASENPFLKAIHDAELAEKEDNGEAFLQKLAASDIRKSSSY